MAEGTRVTGQRSEPVVEIAVRMQSAVSGDPSAGPYPASVTELAEEIAAALAEMESGSAPGLRASLVRAITGQRSDIPAVPVDAVLREAFPTLPPEQAAVTTPGRRVRRAVEQAYQAGREAERREARERAAKAAPRVTGTQMCELLGTHVCGYEDCPTALAEEVARGTHQEGGGTPPDVQAALTGATDRLADPLHPDTLDELQQRRDTYTHQEGGQHGRA